MDRSGSLGRWARRGGGLLLVGFVAIQLVPVERTNPPVRSDVGAPEAVERVLRRACYDCHSNETRWPWYARVAPASWFLADHVDEGRKDLNFSEWPTFDFEAQNHAFKDIRKQIESGVMPLSSYLLLHRDARLDDADRAVLLEWATPMEPPGFDE